MIPIKTQADVVKLDGSSSMEGDLDLNTNQIVNIGELDMNANKIVNMANPTLPQDSVTLSHFESKGVQKWFTISYADQSVNTLATYNKTISGLVANSKYMIFANFYMIGQTTAVIDFGNWECGGVGHGVTSVEAQVGEIRHTVPMGTGILFQSMATSAVITTDGSGQYIYYHRTTNVMNTLLQRTSFLISGLKLE